MEVSITGQHTTLIVLHRDAPGTIAAVTEVMADAGVNICNFRLSRQSRGGEAVMTIEIDGSFGPELNEKSKCCPTFLQHHASAHIADETHNYRRNYIYGT